jgi:transposase-like protein
MQPRKHVDLDAAAAAYQAGASLREVAARHGVSYCTIYRRLIEAGVTLRSPGGSSASAINPRIQALRVELADAEAEARLARAAAKAKMVKLEGSPGG